MDDFAVLHRSVADLAAAVSNLDARSDERHKDRLRDQDETKEKLKELSSEVQSLRSDSDKGKGFLRATVLLGSLIAGTVAIFVGLWNIFTKHGS